MNLISTSGHPAFASAIALGFFALPASAVSIAIANAGFELGTPLTSDITSWTVTEGALPGFWLSNFASASVDPVSAHSGSLYLSASRTVPNPDAVSQPSQSTLSQTVSLGSANTEIADGLATFDVSFYFCDADALDGAQLDVSFFDSGMAMVGSVQSLGNRGANSTAIVGTASGQWGLRNHTGSVPVGAAFATIDIKTQRYGGTAQNLSFDDFSMTVVPEPSVALLGGLGLFGLLRRRRL